MAYLIQQTFMLTGHRSNDKADSSARSNTSTEKSVNNSWIEKANEQAATESRKQPWRRTFDEVPDHNPAGKDLVRMGDDKEMQHSGT
jgi:hypothetical protein